MLRRVPVSAVFPYIRTITSRGQFNPIHDFSESLEEAHRARNVEEFTRMITNPGPMRVGYSSDYLDWLYRAYQSKLLHYDARKKEETRLNVGPRGGSPGSSTLASSGSQRYCREGEEEERGEDLAHFSRPPHSLRRRVGEAKRREAQRELDAVAKAQGMLDLFERQPHFPTIHLSRASRFHLVELFKTILLDRAFDTMAVWDKALLYRAILQERRGGYPPSFDYIFDAVEKTVLAGSESTDTRAGNHPSSPPARTPTEEDYFYFLYLVKRYYVDNAVEGHVVLRCCREPNASELLFSNPPPKEDKEVRASIQSAFLRNRKDGDAEGAEQGHEERLFSFCAPTRYPPIEFLWKCEENLPLLTILVFGELNLMVSENPFVKYPNAHAFLTRPYAEAEEEGIRAGGGRGASASSPKPRGGGGGGSRWDREGDVLSLASLIVERRRHLNLAHIPYILASALDGRAADLRRLQQRYHREDILGFQRLLRGDGESPAEYLSFSDWSYLNPNAVRAEVRDRLQRRGMEALRLYDTATNDLFRVGFEEAEMTSLTRPVEGVHTLPSYIPTLPHFIVQITKDPHVACLLYVVLPSLSPRTGEEEGKSQEMQRLIHQLGSMLHRMALEFHKQELRRVNKQKVNVAATLLDNFVRAELKRCLTRPAEGAEEEEGVKGILRRLGEFRPFEGRMLDESGFTTDARVEDYTRWMAPPVTK
ncbi:unnamed protein product [Phytomonas sp. Hart1]|nr:unnamed protein product [Phytomonas sp. Hart1]|eukprot:CCW71443.1 unnamed protein product [Phytomonas sp. isolate Hart1]